MRKRNSFVFKSKKKKKVFLAKKLNFLSFVLGSTSSPLLDVYPKYPSYLKYILTLPHSAPFISFVFKQHNSPL